MLLPLMRLLLENDNENTKKSLESLRNSAMEMGRAIYQGAQASNQQTNEQQQTNTQEPNKNEENKQ